MINGIVFQAAFQRTLMNIRRRPVILFLSFLQPLIWMTFFGFLFQRFPINPAQGSTMQYIDFLLPGICGMTVLLGSSQSGISLIRDSQSGFLERTMITALDLHAFLLGKITADLSRVIVQAFVVTLLGITLGAVVSVGFSTFFSFLFFILFGLSYSLLSCCIALKTDSQEALSAFIHLVNMPIFFTSTALVPLRAMPSWMEQIAVWNPLTLAVTPVRGAMLSQSSWWNGQAFLALSLMAILLYTLAWKSLNVRRI
ncbi:ABC transporter permease [Synechococcus sp. CC9616]|uniref:ABC transporter permease n=1 Tax=Synechococcus sp. CC9616 TaxID=110663 RepID=UPI00048A47B3|nr:ABC transporter permease [Synechococcus sp. CC9616]